jgi:hypothetical protein
MEYVVNKRRLTVGGLISAAALGTAILAAAPALAQTNAAAEPVRVTAASASQPPSLLGGLLPGPVSDWGTGRTMRTANTDPETRGEEGILDLGGLVDKLIALLSGLLQ